MGNKIGRPVLGTAKLPKWKLKQDSTREQERSLEFGYLESLIKKAKTKEALEKACGEFKEPRELLPDPEQKELMQLVVAKASEFKDKEWAVKFLGLEFGLKIKT